MSVVAQRQQQSQQPHAGQLRYHDFTKLREIHNARYSQSVHKLGNLQLNIGNSNNNNLGTTRMMMMMSLVQQQQPFCNNVNIVQQRPQQHQHQQVRLFFTRPIRDMMRQIELKRLEQVANSNLDDARAQYNFLSELAESHPTAVIKRFKHPKFVHAAVDGNVAVLYLQTLQNTNQYNMFDVNDFLHRLQETTAAPVHHWKKYITDHKLSKPDQIQHILQWLIHGGGPMGTTTTGSMPNNNNMMMMGNIHGGVGGGSPPLISGTTTTAAAAAAASRGVSPKQPIHVQVVRETGSIRATIFSFLARVVTAVVIISALSALMDEKGLGRGGIGGLNSGSKHIQEADTTGRNGKKIKFADVKGVEEAKAELEEIVMYLKDPSRFTRLGGKLPRGLLLTGPPGTGKTLLAKAIAGEADVPFFYASGSQFEEVYVGLGAKRIRELFEAAKKKSPAIIFIDEIDAVGGTRKLKDQSALKMTLNELLVQMDGFDENNGIIVIGATNFMESLDTALLRPGRFDKMVTVPLPDVGGRKEILEMYAKKTKLAKDVDLTILARGTTGFSGADLYNLINQAALKASIDGLPHITMSVLEYAKDKIIMGAERKTAVITKATARTTAYHEAGHAVVAVLTDGAMPIHKATIMPRGRALGMVAMLPEGDGTSQSLKEMLAMMDVAMGGRVAEELIFGKDAITSGAASDIQNATNIARNMVTKFGFSDEIGIVYHGGAIGEDASGSTRNRIDEEVRKLTSTAYQRATDLLMKHSEEHKLLAETLLEYETLTGDEVRDLVLRRIKPNRPVVNKDGGSRGDASIYEKPASSSPKPDNEGSKGRKGGRLFGRGNRATTDEGTEASSKEA